MNLEFLDFLDFAHIHCSDCNCVILLGLFYGHIEGKDYCTKHYLARLGERIEVHKDEKKTTTPGSQRI